ncbi:coiled-coil domain-containing protein 57-like [Hydractinia symbiolongicarpus]|uniref:coiled-coil domain-containing protein 57-like n=1 Tax=Hydractinia symbiolongicarpus TaxID=13093 RepID=UPI00254CFF1E|nr:coiled-coil domain-containing protein 57-like [Hydractinia symbiolongicarpus]
MNTNDKTNRSKLNLLITEKEQEWRVLLQQQMESLTKELAEKDEKVNLEKLRFRKLKEDFEYNLNLLAERDKELARYDELFQQLKARDLFREAEVSEMKIKVADAESKYKQLEMEHVETQKHYQWRLKEYQNEMNNYMSKKNSEVEVERNEYQDLKRKLQQELREVEDNNSYEKQMAMNELNDKFKQREQEYQLNLDKKDTEVHSYQLKVKMLSKELEIVQAASTQAVENLDSNKKSALTLQKKMKEMEWELTDVKNMKDIEIQELRVQLKEFEKQACIKEEEYNRKMHEFERHLNERESIMESLKIAASESENKLRKEVVLLQQKLEEKDISLKRLQWNTTDQLKTKNDEVNRCKEAVSELELKLKQEHESISKTIVARDLEVETLRSSEDQFRREIARLKGDVDRYKNDLAAGMEREKLLESAKTQLEMDWRKRFENKESELYQRNEDLIRNLTNSKTEALSQVKQKDVELAQRDQLIRLLQADKNKAVKFFENNKINYKGLFMNSLTDEDSTESDMQMQNKQLKEVIKEMRTEMEMLTQQMNSRTSTPDPQSKSKNTDYTRDLENEIQQLKTSNRELRNKLEDVAKETKPPHGRSTPTLSDPGVKSHVKELNDTIGHLRNEKVQLTALVTSKQANIKHLMDKMVTLEQDKSQLDVVIESLKYDLSSKTKTYDQNVQSMKHRISELELQLQQARSEAGIYYKNVVERNLDATQVSNKLSQLKLDQLSCKNVSSFTPLHINDDPGKEKVKEKLKLAVSRIKELTRERSQLINAGNKLRAELVNIKDSKNEVKESNGVNLPSHLDRVEKTEYEKTTTNLQTAKNEVKNPATRHVISPVSIDLLVPKEDNTVRSEDTMVSLQHSSSDHSSIKEVWKLLENEDTISTAGTVDDDAIAVVGVKAVPLPKESKPKPVLATRRFPQKKNKTKIRNYNVKDDRK